jgi:hypothetical protein
VEVVVPDRQVVYLLDLQHQLEERVKHGLVPVVSPPHRGDLNQVRDFLFSPFVFEKFQENLAFRGNLLFLSVWADGGRAFPNQRGGDLKSIWAVMVILSFGFFVMKTKIIL